MSIANKQMFLEKLARLCEQYDASFYSAKDQTPVFVSVDGEDVATLIKCNGDDAATALRTAKDRLK